MAIYDVPRDPTRMDADEASVCVRCAGVGPSPEGKL